MKRQAEKQTGNRNIQKDRLAEIQTFSQKYQQTYKQKDERIDRLTNRRNGKQNYRKTDK